MFFCFVLFLKCLSHEKKNNVGVNTNNFWNKLTLTRIDKTKTGTDKNTEMEHVDECRVKVLQGIPVIVFKILQLLPMKTLHSCAR